MLPTLGRSYYSARKGDGENAAGLTLEALIKLFKIVYDRFSSDGFFSEHFGYWCVDAEDVPGKAGKDVKSYVMFHLRRDGLWPISEQWIHYNEVDLFDLIEFLYDHVSKPISGYRHTYSDCGMHWEKFDPNGGKILYKNEINKILQLYGPGYQINEKGEIIESGPEGLSIIFDAKLPSSDDTILKKIKSSIERFRRYSASLDDRRDAVRDLADVLEHIRPQIKTVLFKKDEADLFQIANEFGIRHFNGKQKNDYDPAIWLSWMFYYYLATIYACLHLLRRQR